MSILYGPVFEPTSTKRPVEFNALAVSGFEIVRATGKLYINGTLASITPLSKSPDSNSIGLFYYFTFDFQQVVADALAPNPSNGLTSTFGDGVLDAPYNAFAADCSCTIYAEFEYFYRDATTNQVTNLGITDTSIDYYVEAATRQHRQEMNFINYLPAFNTDNSWLSDAPLQQDICEDENLYLSYIANNAATDIKVVSYDANDAVIDSGLFAISVSSTYQVRTIGAGMANLRAQVYDTGSVDIDNVNLVYYTVALVGLFETPYLETRRFNKAGCCERGQRIHFLNNYAAADAFTFDSKATKGIEAKAQQAQKPLDWNNSIETPHNINDKGSFKIQNEAVDSYDLQSRWLSAADADWLKQLLYSPECYLETVEGLLPVIVEDASLATSTSELPAVTFDIKVTEANAIITLNN
jgi:hypothetical protein